MQQGPQGQKHPAYVICKAGHCIGLATVHVEEKPAPKSAELGSMGGKARAAKR